MAKLYAKSPSGEDALLSISITGFTQSLQQNGWCKLPNGLLLQWRRIPNNSLSESDKRWVSYPINFNSCFVTSIVAASTPDFSGTQYRVAGEMYATVLRVLNDGCGCYTNPSYLISIGI